MGASRAGAQLVAPVAEISGCRVLVTGGTGFIGSHLVAALVDEGAHVVVAAPDPGWRPVVPRLIEQRRIKFVELPAFWDAAALFAAKRRFDDLEALVHLGYSMPREQSPGARARHEVERNVLGSLRLLEALPGTLRQVVLASTVKVYGPEAPSPLRESACPDPRGAYAAGKLALEHHLRDLAHVTDTTAAVLRFSTVYGQMETVPRAIPNFIRQALRGEPPTVHGAGSFRDYVHVADVARLIVRALGQAHPSFAVYNVGSGQGHRTWDVAKLVSDLVDGAPEPVRRPAGGGGDLVCDVGRARTELGFAPKVPLPDGVQQEIDWFRDHPEHWRVT